MVVEGGFDAEYFFARMPVWEALDYISYLPYRDRERWEQARLNALMTAQANSKERLKPTDIMKFPWDAKEELPRTISDEDKERLAEKAKQLQERLYG